MFIVVSSAEKLRAEFMVLCRHRQGRSNMKKFLCRFLGHKLEVFVRDKVYIKCTRCGLVWEYIGKEGVNDEQTTPLLKM